MRRAGVEEYIAGGREPARREPPLLDVMNGTPGRRYASPDSR